MQLLNYTCTFLRPAAFCLWCVAILHVDSQFMWCTSGKKRKHTQLRFVGNVVFFCFFLKLLYSLFQNPYTTILQIILMWDLLSAFIELFYSKVHKLLYFWAQKSLRFICFLQRVANCDIIVIVVIVNADNYMVGWGRKLAGDTRRFDQVIHRNVRRWKEAAAPGFIQAQQVLAAKVKFIAGRSRVIPPCGTTICRCTHTDTQQQSPRPKNKVFFIVSAQT